MPTHAEQTSAITPRLLVIIVNYRTPLMAIDALASVRHEVDVLKAAVKVELIDADSGDESAEFFIQEVETRCWSSWCRIQGLTRNGGFAFANNCALQNALKLQDPPEYLLLLNPDTVAQSGAIMQLLKLMQAQPNVGICGSRLENPDGTTQFAARRFPGILSELESSLRLGIVSRLLNKWKVTEPESDQPHPTDWLPGASLMIRREVFEEIGLLDEGYFMYFEEVDFCLRAKRAGWQVWYVPQSRVVHLVGQSSGVTSTGPQKRRPLYWFDSRKRYFEKNHGRLTRIAADIAFVVGFSVWRLRRWIQRKPDNDPPRLLSDFIWHSLTGKIPA